jgi:hypothetical protein
MYALEEELIFDKAVYTFQGCILYHVFMKGPFDHLWVCRTEAVDTVMPNRKNDQSKHFQLN